MCKYRVKVRRSSLIVTENFMGHPPTIGDRQSLVAAYIPVRCDASGRKVNENNSAQMCIQ